MIGAAVRTDIHDVASLISVLLVLITLFTSEQSRVLDVERHRVGGPRQPALKRTIGIAAALVLVTVVVLLALANLAGRAVTQCCGDPVEVVFDVVWLLLVPLAAWQVGLLVNGARMLKAL